MNTFEICVNCRKRSPVAETDYTLIGPKHGWRLTRSKQADGSLRLDWRCPTCWLEYKRNGEGGPSV
jgi:hypothetical protein